ncbi:MAG: SH3 domain-containing protein [Rhodospirillales bacterium]
MVAAAAHPRHTHLPGNRDRRGAALALLVVAAVLLSVSLAPAAEKTVTFMGQKVPAYAHGYIVLKDVNVRAKADTKSEKVGSLKEGDHVQSVARAQGGWLAIRDGATDLGYVHESALLPLIDGTLAKDIRGKTQVKDGPICDYVIRFEGKSPVEGQLFEIADYDVSWDCLLDGHKIGFRTPMFITEAPFQLNQKRVFQINVDVLDLYGGNEDILSTIMLFDQDKNRVVFDSVTLQKYGRVPPAKEAPAMTVAEALDGAARIAVAAWNKSAWSDLIKNLR